MHYIIVAVAKDFKWSYSVFIAYQGNNGNEKWVSLTKRLAHSPIGKFHRTEGAPPETCPNVKYDAPEEVAGDTKGSDSPIRKWGLIQILYVNSSRALTLWSLTAFCCR